MDAKELRETLRELGLSQTDLSKILNISDRNVRHWCAGEGPIPGCVVVLTRTLRAYPEILTTAQNAAGFDRA